MKYKNLLNEWKKFIGEAEISSDAMLSAQQDVQKAEQEPPAPPTEQEKKEAAKSTILGDAENTFHDINALAAKLGVDKSALRQDLKLKIDQLIKEELQAFILEKDDRCTRIAKRKYNVWPSAYASGAVVKCRQGKIWKGVSEDISDKEVEIVEETIDEAKKPYKPNFSKEKEQGLHGWFARNDGKGWVNCRTGGPCGRESADSGGKYPACRPTKAQCKSAGKGPLRKKKSSKAISWTKKNKKD
jgi:hypothetical protein